MRVRNVDLLVVGATFTGLGSVWESKQTALVVERTAMPGHEFIDACRPGTGGYEASLTPTSRKTVEDWKVRNILEGDRIHLASLTPLLYQEIKQRNIPVAFHYEILRVTPEGGGFRVRLSNSGGEEEVICRRILDTTTTRLSTPGKPATCTGKKLGAILMRPISGNNPLPAEPDIVPSRFSSEGYLQLEVPQNASWPQAREALIQRWQRRPAEQAEWKVAFIATAFVQEVKEGPHPQAENWVHLPSAAYANPLRAFDAGVRFVAE